MLDIAHERGRDAELISQELFGKPVTEVGRAQASSLILEIKKRGKLVSEMRTVDDGRTESIHCDPDTTPVV